MLKVAFTKRELEKLLEVIHFTPMQKRIIMYRLDEETRVKMADLEKVSVSTIDREIKEIAKKIKKAYDDNLIVF
jgi:glutathione synthase/RimK-type ligase-like ATP-grasp enzyme